MIPTLKRDAKLVILLPTSLKKQLATICEAKGRNYADIGNELIEKAVKQAIKDGLIDE